MCNNILQCVLMNIYVAIYFHKFLVPSRHDLKIVDWDVKPQPKPTKQISRKNRKRKSLSKIKWVYSNYTLSEYTVKFLNLRRPKNFAVNYLKFKQRGQTLGCFVKMMQME